MSERFITDTLNKADTDFDISLRPSRFADFVGQRKVRERLELFVEAARGREDVLDHILLADNDSSQLFLDSLNTFAQLFKRGFILDAQSSFQLGEFSVDQLNEFESLVQRFPQTENRSAARQVVPTKRRQHRWR